MCGYTAARDRSRPAALVVQPQDAGRRLDLFLAERLALSRAQVRRLLASGAVRAGRARASARATKGVRARERASASRSRRSRAATSERALAEPGAAAAWCARRGRAGSRVDKPAGMPVHPLREDETGTLLNARDRAASRDARASARAGCAAAWCTGSTSTPRACCSSRRERRELAAAARGVSPSTASRRSTARCVLGRARARGRGRAAAASPRAIAPRACGSRAREGERARGARIGRAGVRLLEVFARRDAGRGAAAHRLPAPDPRDARASRATRSRATAAYGRPCDATGAARHMLHAARVGFEEIAARESRRCGLRGALRAAARRFLGAARRPRGTARRARDPRGSRFSRSCRFRAPNAALVGVEWRHHARVPERRCRTTRNRVPRTRARPSSAPSSLAREASTSASGREHAAHARDPGDRIPRGPRCDERVTCGRTRSSMDSSSTITRDRSRSCAVAWSRSCCSAPTATPSISRAARVWRRCWSCAPRGPGR